MSEVQTITDIKEISKSIKANMKNIDVSQYGDAQFGDEREYTYKELLEGVDSLLTDVTTLTKTPKQFLKIATYDERVEIQNCLSKVDSDLQNPNSLLKSLDELKRATRPFHIRYTKERLLSFDEELSALTRKKVEFSRQLSNLEKRLTKIKNSEDEANKTSQSLMEQQSTLTDAINQGQKEINTFNNNAEHLAEIRQKVDSYKELVDNFVAKIVERETQLENQGAQTSDFNEKLKEFTAQRDELLKTAKFLIQEAKTALGYKKAAGIAAAFQERLMIVENAKGWLWIVSAIAFIVLGILLTIYFISENPSTDFSTTLARLSIVSLPLAGAWFCAGQYTKLKNIAEDYAYKTVLAQSIIGFSEQLKSDDEKDTSYQDYMKKMLDEIHQHPVPKHMREKENITLAEKIVEKLKKLLNKDKDNDGS